MTFALVPISAYGGGVVVLPWEGVVLSALALDPSGTPHNNDLTEAFDDGVMVLASGHVTIKPFGLAGPRSSGSCGATRSACRSSRIRATSPACS